MRIGIKTGSTGPFCLRFHLREGAALKEHDGSRSTESRLIRPTRSPAENNRPNASVDERRTRRRGTAESSRRPRHGERSCLVHSPRAFCVAGEASKMAPERTPSSYRIGGATSPTWGPEAAGWCCHAGSMTPRLRDDTIPPAISATGRARIPQEQSRRGWPRRSSMPVRRAPAKC